jgi:GT2 family glycosyltransferase
LPVTVVQNIDNFGFAAACNQGARECRADLLLFLNPDTLLLTESLAVPASFMADPINSRVGICGIQLLDGEGGIDRSCSRFPTTSMALCKMLGLDKLLPPSWARQRMTDWEHTTSRDVDQVIGAFFLVRRSLFETLGGFDERFFVYYEEVDFSFRAATSGYRSRYLAGARAVHRGGGCTEQVKARRLAYSLRSRMEYALKHFSGPSAAALILATLLIEPGTRSAAALLRGSFASCRDIMACYRNLWKIGPTLMRRALQAD